MRHGSPSSWARARAAMRSGNRERILLMSVNSLVPAEPPKQRTAGPTPAARRCYSRAELAAHYASVCAITGPATAVAGPMSRGARIMSAWLWMTRLGSRASGTQALSIAAMPSRFSISRKMRTPPSEESCPPSNVAVISLPPTGDSPGRKRVASVMVSGSSWGIANDTVSTTES